jgi:hypothetical protein
MLEAHGTQKASAGDVRAVLAAEQAKLQAINDGKKEN